MSKESSKSFYSSLVIITFIVSSIMLLFQFTSLVKYLNAYAWYILIYMVALSAFTYFLRDKGIKTGDAQDVYNYTMLATTARLLISAVVLLIYFFKVKENLETFIFNFFVIYFIYTAFEIKSLFPKLQTLSEKESKSSSN